MGFVPQPKPPKATQGQRKSNKMDGLPVPLLRQILWRPVRFYGGQDGPETLEDGAKTGQDGAKMPPRWTKTVSRRAENTFRCM